MRIRVLGPVEVAVDDGAAALGGAKQRGVLAMLALEANQVVTADRLILGLWGEEPPASAPKMVQNYVWRLRRALDDEAGAVIVTRGGGYELAIEPDCVDVRRFERLVGAAARAAAAGQRSAAARQALELWRGPPLIDVAEEPFAAEEIRRLEGLRVDAAELAIDAELAAGRHREVLAEIEQLSREHPLREHVHAQRMLALYRCGRQAEALDGYRQARRVLVDAVGLEPGLELQGLQNSILRRDPSLRLEPSVAELPRELDPGAASPMFGRERELASLRTCWKRAVAGAGGLVAVTGERGSGRTRLAAELAAEVHRGGSSVLYVSGAGGAEDVADALRRVGQSRGPTLLVVDDADARAETLDGLGALARDLPGRPVLVVATVSRGLDGVPGEELPLAPLDLRAAGEIVLLYGPQQTFPVAELLASSGGIAGRVHALAGEWAVQAATRRVAAVASRAAAGRDDLRSAEAALAGGVVDLQLARERKDWLNGGGPSPAACPFKGLASFEFADARWFFGRERLVAELVARAVGAPLLSVVGASGSGKSSLVKAGLLPALAGGALPGSGEWALRAIRPGDHPMRELSTAGPGARSGVLVIDQFEEIFTACRDHRERAAFVEALTDRCEAGDGLVVVAIRADFYGRCAAYPVFSRLVGSNHVLVGPMTRDEVRRAIEGPAHSAGVHVEAALVDALVEDVAGRPGGLPLLSTALQELWAQRDGRRLSYAAYVQSGGVQGAVTRLGEAAFGEFDSGQQRVARTVMLRLAGEDANGAVVRRRVPLAELQGSRSEDLAVVLASLTERRLLTMSSTTVEVAHEALLHEWPRVRRWLAEDAESRRVQRHLADAAAAWQDRGRDPGELYRGARLAVALEWRADHHDEVNATEQAFLDAGRAAAERAHRRLKIGAAVITILLAVAVASGLAALQQRSVARAEAVTAEAQRIGLQALTDPDLARSLLLARQSVALSDSPVTRGDLLAALLRAPAAVAVFGGDGTPLNAIAVSPDARTLALGDRDGIVRFVDTVTRRSVRAPFRSGGAISAVCFSPDGARLAIAGYDRTGFGFVALLDARTDHIVRRLDTGFDSATTTSGVLNVGTVAFSPDSRVMIADVFGGGHTAMPGYPERRYLDRWDARTGRRLELPQPLTSDLSREPALVGFAAGARQLVTSTRADGTVLRDAVTLHARRVLAGAGWPVAVSPNGRQAAVALASGALRLIDLRTGRERLVRRPGRRPIIALAFTPDARRLVTADGVAPPSVWEIRRATPTETLPGLAGVNRLAIAADGATLYGAGDHGTVVAWDLTGARGFGRALRATPGGAGDAVAVSASGPWVAVPERDYVDVIDSRTGTRSERLHVPAVSAIAISPDGRTMATGSRTGVIRFFSLRTGRPSGRPQSAHVGTVLSLVFTSSGHWLASAGADRAIYLWDVRRSRAVKLYSTPPGNNLSPPSGLSASPDEQKLVYAIAHSDGTGELDVLSIPDLALLAQSRVTPGGQTLFSRDGQLLLYGDSTGQVWKLDARTLRPHGLPVAGPPGPDAFALSPDDRMLATTSAAGTTQLWDVPSGRPIGSPLTQGGGAVHAAFIADGRELVTLSQDGRGTVWDLRPRAWAARACALAARSLTLAEWRAALPERPYAPACAHAIDQP